MKRSISCILLSLLLLGAVPAGAASVYNGFVYDGDGQAVPSPNIYEPYAVYDGESAGTAPFSNPQDLFVDGSGRIYVADTDNSRIVVLDAQGGFLREFTGFTQNGELSPFNKPEGLFVDEEGLLYVADTGNNRVAVADQSGALLRIIAEPKSALLSENYVFQPKKVVVDSSDTVFVLAKDVYQGMLSFDDKGAFIGFYGQNRVEMTFQIALDRLWRKFLTREQIEDTQRYVPSEYTNIDIGQEDFVYTCDLTADTQIKQLNSMGVDILNTQSEDRVYGDLDYEMVSGQAVLTKFTDVNVDSDGFISALDITRGRVFKYDNEGNLLGAFGSLGSQTGSFKLPSALENLGRDILVLDAAKANITLFKPTAFGACITEAVKLYNDGLYAEAMEPWQEVLRRNQNYEMAYKGLGKACLKLEDYEGAMKYLKLAGDNVTYSEAFGEYRNAFIRRNFGWLLAAAAVGIAALYVGGRAAVRAARARRNKKPGA